jgi:TPR repeat protein
MNNPKTKNALKAPYSLLAKTALILLLLAAPPLGCGGGSFPRFLRNIFPDKKTATLIPNPPGEAEFLAQNYVAATLLLAKAAAEGNVRAIFYLRVIRQRGLDGLLQPALAQRDLDNLAFRYPILVHLARDAPTAESHLYQTALATLHYLGRTPDKKPDLSQALSFARPAAEANFPPAVNLMAALALAASQDADNTYFFSGGLDSAFDWAQKGADQKDVLALGNLSYLRRRGLGVAQDDYVAASLAHAAATAKTPLARAQNDLGVFYEMGKGVSPDPLEAARWYELAAKRGYPLAQTNLERLTDL